MVRGEEKGQLYWAKGTGFGTGSTQQSWNVEQALVRQRTEEEHVTVLMQVTGASNFEHLKAKHLQRHWAGWCGRRRFCLLTYSWSH